MNSGIDDDDLSGEQDSSTGEASPIAQVVSVLEEDIVFGRLHQNQRLVEDELIERFGAKRHIIRQALVELERIGIVERIPNKGSRVRSFSAETINQLYVMRELLETNAVALMPLPLAQADLDKLKTIQAVHDQAVDEGDVHQVFHSNIQFHRTIFGLCNNQFLSAAINEYAFRAHGIRFYSMNDPAHQQRARSEHHEMIAALERADRDKLAEICRRHLQPPKDSYLRMVRMPEK